MGFEPGLLSGRPCDLSGSLRVRIRRCLLMRNLNDRSPAADLFGVKGRSWLAEQELAVCEGETVDGGPPELRVLHRGGGLVSPMQQSSAARAGLGAPVAPQWPPPAAGA